VVGLCSNGLTHQADEVEFVEAAECSLPPAAEAAEPREMMEDEVPVGDASCEQAESADGDVKPVDDDAGVGAAADQEPALTDQSQPETASEQERQEEMEELEQEVEGILS